MEKGLLEECSQQAWCQQVLQGSKRLPKEWLKARAMWIDAEGVPLKLDIEESMAKALELSTEAEAEYSHMEGWKFKTACMTAEELALENHGVMECEAYLA